MPSLTEAIALNFSKTPILPLQRPRRRHETMSQGVFRNYPRPQELLQIVLPARLDARPRHAHAAEWLRSDSGAGDLAIDVEIADAKVASRQLDVLRESREYAAGQREVAVECHRERCLEIVCPHDREHGAEDLFARQAVMRLDAGENGRGHIEPRIRDSAAIEQLALPAPDCNVSLD